MTTFYKEKKDDVYMDRATQGQMGLIDSIEKYYTIIYNIIYYKYNFVPKKFNNLF